MLRRKLLLATVTSTAVALLAIALWTEGACYWTPLTPEPLPEVPALPAALRTGSEHDALYPTVPRPYALELHDRALVLGFEHTQDPSDPQLEVLRSRFAAWSPTLVLVEGRLGWCLGGPDALTERFGESGTAVGLAWRSGVRFATLEPSFEAEAADTAEAFGAERSLAFYFLRVFVGDRDGEGLGSDRYAAALGLLRKRASRTGLDGTFADLAAFDAFWSANGLTKHGDWRELPAEALWRDGAGTWLQRVAEHVNAFRDRHAVARVAHAVRGGERVLVVQGLSHTILAEAALRVAVATTAR